MFHTVWTNHQLEASRAIPVCLSQTNQEMHLQARGNLGGIEGCAWRQSLLKNARCETLYFL